MRDYLECLQEPGTWVAISLGLFLVVTVAILWLRRRWMDPLTTTVIAIFVVALYGIYDVVWNFICNRRGNMNPERAIWLSAVAYSVLCISGHALWERIFTSKSARMENCEQARTVVSQQPNTVTVPDPKTKDQKPF